MQEASLTGKVAGEEEHQGEDDQEGDVRLQDPCDERTEERKRIIYEKRGKKGGLTKHKWWNEEQKVKRSMTFRGYPSIYIQSELEEENENIADGGTIHWEATSSQSIHHHLFVTVIWWLL